MIKQQGSFLDDFRQKLFNRDTVEVSSVKHQMDEEEKELKSFFQEQKKPVKDDPTLIRREKYDEKMSAYRQAMEGLDFKNMINTFWHYQPPTPEEIETLNDIRQKIVSNISIFGLAGLAITSSTSIYYRREFPRYLKVFGFFVGLIGGGIFGILNSTEYSLKRLEQLGPDYTLGRLAIQEIDEYRMDKKIFQKN